MVILAHTSFMFSSNLTVLHPLQELSEEDYFAIVSGWSEKLGRSNSGDQRWGLFYATKD